mmetsp:Transcript_4065/g.11372  ORF Transcript_4065/g.11372 Transcript_4065/m.11372 type:complete len:207 (-) Transcript_4065:477-1097(-)
MTKHSPLHPPPAIVPGPPRSPRERTSRLPQRSATHRAAVPGKELSPSCSTACAIVREWRRGQGSRLCAGWTKALETRPSRTHAPAADRSQPPGEGRGQHARGQKVVASFGRDPGHQSGRASSPPRYSARRRSGNRLAERRCSPRNSHTNSAPAGPGPPQQYFACGPGPDGPPSCTRAEGDHETSHTAPSAVATTPTPHGRRQREGE